MKDDISIRLSQLREAMTHEGLDAYIFPSTDPHCGEYVPDHWHGREFISGFGGSAGTAVVTSSEAALWTDSRYFIAAAEALRGTEYRLMRLGVDGTPTVAEWLGRKLAPIEGAEVGVDGMACPASVVEGLVADLRKQGGITLRTNYDPLLSIWRDRPPLPAAPIEVHPVEFAGETTGEKLARVRQALRAEHAYGMLMSALDDIAWTLNLRGSDVRFCPVFVAYLLLEGERTTLFVDPAKLSPAARAALAEASVEVRQYADVAEALRRYGEYNILMDPDATCYALFRAVGRAEVVRRPSPVAALKAVKNAAEQAGFRRAAVRDGVAMARFLCALKADVARGGMTEMDVVERIERLRGEWAEYRGPSFGTIAAYADHAAIVHYEPTPATAATLRPSGLLLIDTGAQYVDATTDLTRTIALGPTTAEECRAYTLVLKGHIALERAVFPSGASGTQLDALAREPMWREGMNFLHGTGHGVGSYLNVHEGPHQIRMEWRPAPIVAGTTVTDEPGLYVEGRFGVRTENTLIAVNHSSTPFGNFLAFEPLTLCPIDKAPIERALLTDEEVAWLNSYHAEVFRVVAPHVDEATRRWLEEACAKLD